MYQKECGLTIKVRRLTIVELLLCDIMTELTLTPKIKPVYLMITLHLFLYLKTVLDGNSFPDISPLFIHDEGVANLLSNLDDHKASGPDEIPTTLLKTGYCDISCTYYDFSSISSPVSNPYGLEIS